MPTETILDVAEFDLASQNTTKEDKMLKDAKRILHTVLRMEKGIEIFQRNSKTTFSSFANKQVLPLPLNTCHPRHYTRSNQDIHSCQSSLRTLSPLNYFNDQSDLSPPALDLSQAALGTPSLDAPMLSPIGGVNPNFQELASSEIDRTELTIPNVLLTISVLLP